MMKLPFRFVSAALAVLLLLGGCGVKTEPSAETSAAPASSATTAADDKPSESQSTSASGATYIVSTASGQNPPSELTASELCELLSPRLSSRGLTISSLSLVNGLLYLFCTSAVSSGVCIYRYSVSDSVLYEIGAFAFTEYALADQDTVVAVMSDGGMPLNAWLHICPGGAYSLVTEPRLAPLDDVRSYALSDSSDTASVLRADVVCDGLELLLSAKCAASVNVGNGELTVLLDAASGELAELALFSANPYITAAAFEPYDGGALLRIALSPAARSFTASLETVDGLGTLIKLTLSPEADREDDFNLVLSSCRPAAYPLADGANASVYSELWQSDNENPELARSKVTLSGEELSVWAQSVLDALPDDSAYGHYAIAAAFTSGTAVFLCCHAEDGFTAYPAYLYLRYDRASGALAFAAWSSAGESCCRVRSPSELCFLESDPDGAPFPTLRTVHACGGGMQRAETELCFIPLSACAGSFQGSDAELGSVTATSEGCQLSFTSDGSPSVSLSYNQELSALELRFFSAAEGLALPDALNAFIDRAELSEDGAAAVLRLYVSDAEPVRSCRVEIVSTSPASVLVLRFSTASGESGGFGSAFAPLF